MTEHSSDLDPGNGVQWQDVLEMAGQSTISETKAQDAENQL